MFTDLLRQQTTRATVALRAVSRDAAAYQTLSDESLLDVTRSNADQQRLLGSQASLVAGEIARRSAPELGHAGLAQRTGHRTALELVRVTTGQSARDAAAGVRAGLDSQDAARDGTIDPLTEEIFVPAKAWMLSAGTALLAGTISVADAESIRNGLGEPAEGVTAAQLAVAAEWLCQEARTLDADRLFRRARELRDELDEMGIVDRERARHDARSLRIVRLPSGMTRLVWTMDQETAAVVGDLFDGATSPRRGGPRFVGEEDRRLSDRIADDERTTEQLASDVFAELLRHGADAESSELLATGAPVVRLLVAQEALDSDGTRLEGSRSGHGRIEAQPDPVSLETIERATCAGSVTPLLFDESGQALDVGREQRLFTRRQRVSLAARDGGCRFPGCDRPPSWTEAHHIKHWQRDAGGTDIADGILLCRHHHLLCHNNHWEIERAKGEYRLIPPPNVDSFQVPIPMPTKSVAMRELMRR